MPELVHYSYEFGPFRLDTAMRVLWRAEHAVALQGATLDVLIALVEQHRQWVGRRALAMCQQRFGHAEKASHVVKQTSLLAQQIDSLRALLSSQNSELIEAHPRKGYRFVVDVLLATELEMQTYRGETEAIVSSLAHAAAPQSKPSASSGARRSQTIKPGMTAGRFEIISLLGSGGMGEVYLARDVQLDRKVALKVLPLKFTRIPDWMRRFNREACNASALNHPNILTIHEIGEWQGRHYIATEYIEGQTLRIRMLSARLSITEALHIAEQIANALVAAHAANIVHRDIKPENIMIRPDGYVKLLDFGLAKPLADNDGRSAGHTLPGVIMGTANYMSPEQARGLPVDARSDVFGLGAVLYEMLTGAQPFVGVTASDVMAAVLERQPAPLGKNLQQPVPALQRLVDKALSKDLTTRFQSIKDLKAQLQAVQRELELDTRESAAVAQRSAQRLTGPALSGENQPAGDAAGSPQSFASAPTKATVGVPSEAIWQIPEVRYARSGEVNIAYQVIGDAPLDLVFVMGWISHLEYFWTEPSFARFLRRLAGFARVILFDKRGTGLSDRVPLDQLPTLEQRMDDVRAVMEAVGSERAVLCGVSEGGPMCSLFAASYPERTIALVMMGSYARRLRGEGYPWGPSVADRDLFLQEILQHWGGPVGLEERAPSVAADPAFRAWWAAYLRRGASPAAAVALTRMNTEIDIRHVLGTVRVPTLVVHRSGDLCLKVQEGRYLADNIPGAKFVELPGIDHLPFVGAQDEILDEIEEFLTGVRHATGFDRVLATVLVADVVAAEQSPADSITRFQQFFRKEVELFKGKWVETTFPQRLATFDGPARAIRAACAVRASALRLGIHLQIGLHTGECDVLDNQVSGIAVDIARQVTAQSASGEILASSTVKDLVAGSGIVFADRGLLTLSGTLGEWRLFAVQRG